MSSFLSEAGRAALCLVFGCLWAVLVLGWKVIEFLQFLLLPARRHSVRGWCTLRKPNA